MGKIVKDLSIAPTHFQTMEGVLAPGGIGVVDNELLVNMSLFVPPVLRSAKDFVLYYLDEYPNSFAKIKELVDSEGYIFVMDPHPSLLISAMRHFDGEKDFGLQEFKVVMPAKEVVYLGYLNHFLAIRVRGESKKMVTDLVDYDFNKMILLLEKK